MLLSSQPEPNTIPIQVIDLDPQRVWLAYNCEYMKDICKNAVNFYTFGRAGRANGFVHPASGIDQLGTVFGYDFHTGKQPSWRSYQRRENSCPSHSTPAWKDYHTCPEPNQRTVMRSDRSWPYTELEPNSAVSNQIRNYVDTAGILRESKMRYTCDEFPPATWIEGGGNRFGDDDDKAQTRCAAMKCSSGIKAEQDWQANAHNNLQRQLKKLIRRRKINSGSFPYYEPKNSIALFGFGMYSDTDGVAARVMTYADTDMDVLEEENNANRAKRNTEEGGNNTTSSKGWKISMEQLKAMVQSGHATEYVVPANNSNAYYSTADLTGTTVPMSWMGMNRWTDDDDDLGDDTEDDVDALHNVTTVRHNHHHGSMSHMHVPIKRQTGSSNASDVSIAPLLTNSSIADVEKARRIVEEAIVESSKRNQARLLNPLRNNYGLKPGTYTGTENMEILSTEGEGEGFTNDDAVVALLEISDDLAAAAALVAEADAAELPGNLTKRAMIPRATGTYWMESIKRMGTVPWGDDAAYAVYRNVRDFGAKGDGVTDDTKAFKAAMIDGKRCGKGCNGSTIKNAIVYIPPGTYLISTTIPLPFGTQVIGDANTRPTILASKNFIGMGVLSTDEYTGGGKGTDGLDQQYYVNTANFYRQLRNVIIDVTQTRASQKVSCLHYQVAQATSLQNVKLIAGPTQYGMYAENGSGGQISDVEFQGGAVGLFGGSQQFTAQRLKFTGCTVGVQLIWDWGWVWKSVTMNNVGTGFKLVPETGSSSTGQTVAAPGNIGSASFLDSSFTNVKTIVVITPPTSKPASGSTGLILENIKLSGVGAAVADTTGRTILAGSTDRIDEWAMGPIYAGSADAKARTYSTGSKIGSFRRDKALVDNNEAYFERAKPQYENLGVGDFVHAKDLGCKGDGKTDDTAAFQAALFSSVGKVLFVDAGSYILSGTVTVPSGVKIVGETWSQLVASGPYFSDASKPKVMLKVGNPGQVGDVEMQDLIFTTVGGTAGAILVEWNIKASSPGAAALWDCHARVGGALGTKLTPDECPPVTSGISGVNSRCNAASLMMHLTKSGSGYFENMWLWVADHMIE